MKKLMQVCMLVAAGMSLVSVSHAGEVADEVKEVMETVTPVAESVSDKLAQYLTAAEGVMEQYGGQAVDLGLNVLRIEAASLVIPPLLILMVLLITIAILHKRVGGWAEKYSKASDGASWVPVGILAIAASIVGWTSILKIFNIWAWVGIFWPEAYAVHKFLM